MEELRVGPVAGERGRHISDRAAESCIRQVRLVQAMVQNAFPFLGPMGCPHASDQVGQVLITRVAQMTSPSTSHHLIRIQHLHLNSYSCTYHTHHPVYNLGSRILAELELNLAIKEENLIMGLFLLTETRTHKLGISWGLLSTQAPKASWGVRWGPLKRRDREYSAAGGAFCLAS